MFAALNAMGFQILKTLARYARPERTIQSSFKAPSRRSSGFAPRTTASSSATRASTWKVSRVLDRKEAYR